jgi:predicted Rossmann fold flavoprotein
MISSQNKEKKYDVIIIGAGAAGLMACYKTSNEGLKTLVIEKNKMSGKKLLITGKGRCNITANCDDVDELVDKCIHNGRYMYSSFMNYSNKNIIDFFKKHGLKLKEERGKRIFPESDRAKDVVEALMNSVNKNNSVFLYSSPVKDIIVSNDRVEGIILRNEKKYFADKVIIATGGMSYPDTGSTGDGYLLAEKTGHRIIKPVPALVPLETREKWVSDIMGLSLRNISIKLLDEKERTVYKDFGEMLFTHFGISGPVILSASSHIDFNKSRKYSIIIDLKPALDMDKLYKRITRDFEEHNNKIFKNSLNRLLPGKLIDIIVMLSNINPVKKTNQITKEEKLKIVNLLKNFRLEIKNKRPLKEAIVTRGGVSIKDINPKTMESKKVNGLYFAGEIIDVDGYTGGFNLTIAFSSGYTSGKGCTED